MQRTVLISESHPYRLINRYGGHQYADVFVKYGWKALIFLSNFCIYRLLLTQSTTIREFITLWRNKRERISKNIINYCVAHFLPHNIRYVILGFLAIYSSFISSFFAFNTQIRRS